MGIGQAVGENRAEKAALQAINSPLQELSISGAKGVLFAVAGGDDLTLHEISQAAKIITESIDKDAKVIFGPTHDEKLKKGEIRITVIATGFPVGLPKRTLFQSANTEPTEVVKEIHNLKEPKQEEKVIIDDDEEKWTAVPAFLRRKK